MHRRKTIYGKQIYEKSTSNVASEKEVTRRLDIVKIYTDVVREAYSSNLPKSDTELIDKEYSLAMTNYGKCTVLSQDIIK